MIAPANAVLEMDAAARNSGDTLYGEAVMLMSMKVSDLQVLMLRSQDVGKIQHTQKMSESVQQQTFADGLVRQSEVARQTVQTLPRAEQGKIDGDQAKKERDNASRRQAGTGKPVEDQVEEAASPFTGTIIDCKI
jgi:hypothetical protein